MSTLEELIITQTKVLTEVLHELKEIKTLTLNDDVKTCTSKQAIALLGVNNTRYLTHFFNLGLLNRRKGGAGHLYFKAECKALADKLAAKEIVLPSLKDIYGK